MEVNYPPSSNAPAVNVSIGFGGVQDDGVECAGYDGVCVGLFNDEFIGCWVERADGSTAYR